MFKFLKSVIAEKTGTDLETLVFLNSHTFEDALSLWLEYLIRDLDAVGSSFSKIQISAATVSDLAEKRLEKEHAEFISDVMDQLDLILSRKSYQYAKMCRIFLKPKNLAEQAKALEDGKAYLANLDRIVRKLQKLSQGYGEAKNRHLLTLTSRKDLFYSLTAATKMTSASILADLKNGGGQLG